MQADINDCNEARVSEELQAVSETTYREKLDLFKQVRTALELITRYGGIEGEHHKTWVIDQVARILTGPHYEEWVKEYEGEEVDGEPMYDWDTGIAP